MEKPDRSRWWKSQEFWILASISATGTIFTITGPVPRDWLHAIPARLGSVIVGLTGFLSRFGSYIAVLALILLMLWRRRDVVKAVRLIKEWLFVRPLAYFLRPVVRRIVGAPVSNAVIASRPGWKVDGNWEIQEEETANWELGPDSIRGKYSGTAFWTAPLPKACRIEFEARFTENKDSDEIDVIVGGVKILYYRDGVRLDRLKDDLSQERVENMVKIPGPQLDRWYRYLVEVTDKNKCVVTIDGKRIVDFDCNQRRSWLTGRLGFAHWHDTIEFRNLKAR